MSTHTAAEQACFDALVEHNGPMDRDEANTYPSVLWPIAEAATKAVLDTIREQRAAAVEDSADKCPKCYYPSKHGQPDGELYCDNCGWSA